MEAARISLLGRITLLGASIPAILGLFAYGVVLPSIAKDFHALPHAELLSQLVGGIVGIAFAIASPIMGILISKFGYRIVYFWSVLVFSLSGLSVMLLDNLYVILFARVVLGAAVAGALVAASTGIGTLPSKERAQLFGLQTVAGGGLGVLSYIVVAKLTDFGWRAPFALHVLGFALLPFILMLPKIGGAATHHAHGAAATGTVQAKSGGIAALGGLTVPLVVLALYMGMTALLPPLFGPFYLGSIGITDPVTMALPMMAAAFAATIAAAFYGRIQGKIGINGTFAVTLLFIGVGAGLSGMTSTLGMFTMAQVVLSIGLAWTIANLNAASVLVATPQGVSRAIAIVNGIYYGAQSLLPFVAQVLRQIAGPGGVFGGYAVVGIAAAIIYFIITFAERRHPHVTPEATADAMAEALES